jgi:hypothetical protein
MDHFNWKYYINSYPDLQRSGINTFQKALEHWTFYGMKEGRICNPPKHKFDWKYYIRIYPDLQRCGINTYQKALEHWTFYGMKEGRICNPQICSNGYNVSNKSNRTNEPYILHDDFLVRTRKFNTPAKINCPTIDNLNAYNEFILVIDFSNGGGGTTHFLNCIVSKYKSSTTFLIARNFDGLVYFYINDMLCLKQTFNKEDSINYLDEIKCKIIKIFVNHTYGHDINFLNKIFNLEKHVASITHDYSLILNTSQAEQPCFPDIILPSNRNVIDINKYDMIITQNIVTTNIYNKYINPDKIKISELPDYYKSDKLIHTNNHNIVIGFIGSLIKIKGCEVVNNIYKLYKNNSNVKCIIFGLIDIESDIQCIKYNDMDELNNLLITHKPNLLIETSIWPETYSYTLTLSMLTDLPILYLKKAFPSVIENRLKKYKKAYPFSNLLHIDNLIFKFKQNYFYTIDKTIKFNIFWEKYFITPTTNKKIKPYCIYFPQFHSFPENDINFYKDYTDIENLNLLKEETKSLNILSPSLQVFNLKKITDYNLLNKNIIQKQIDLITDFDICGFAMYYYWFSENSITDNNMLMRPVIDNFFDNTIKMNNRKIFFIWANESWSNNSAFGDTGHIIVNTYNIDDFNKNIDNIIPYFIHENYLKIDNKPVFFLHHPWVLTTTEINIFYDLLNNKCIQNNYNGVHLVLNSINNKYDNYINYNHTFNYKSNNAMAYNEVNKYAELDYTKYVNDYDNDNNNDNSVQVLAFDFDNRARLFKPNKLNKATICINNDETSQISFINKIVNKYNKHTTSDVEKILLINAWNEWGEKMVIEPSNERGFYYLNLIKKYITK